MTEPETWEEKALRCAIEADAFDPKQMVSLSRDDEALYDDLDTWFEDLRSSLPCCFKAHVVAGLLGDST